MNIILKKNMIKQNKWAPFLLKRKIILINFFISGICLALADLIIPLNCISNYFFLSAGIVLGFWICHDAIHKIQKNDTQNENLKSDKMQ